MGRAAAPKATHGQRRRRATAASAPVASGAAVRGAADGRAARRSARRARTGAQPAGDPVVRRAEPEPTLPPIAIGRFEDLIALAAQKRDLGVKIALERDVRLVRCEDGRLEIALGAERGQDAGQRSRAQVLAMDQPALDGGGLGRSTGQPTVKSQDDARQAELKTGVRADPLVQAVLARFPGAEIVDVRKARRCRRRCRPGDPEEPMPELPPDDDGSAFGFHGRSDEDEL